MRKIFHFIALFMLAVVFKLTRAEKDEQKLLDLINNRSEAALKYKFPIDARMYETTDRNPLGMNQYFGQFLTIF